MDGNPRILLLGDYSNCHRALATGLRRLGCDVTVMSNGSMWQNCERDIDISRRPGKFGGLQLYLKAKYQLHKYLRGYDIVSIHDPNFLTLRPRRLKPLFDRLVRENGSVFLNAMSTDRYYLEMCADPAGPLRYSEWFVGSEPSRHHLANLDNWQKWHTKEISDYHKYVYSKLDGAVAVLYEYYLGLGYGLPPEKIAYGGIPIDTSALEPVDLAARQRDKIRIFLGRDRTRKLQKGTDLLEIASRRVVERHPDKAELVIVENRPYDEFIGLLRSADIVLDQIYSYTPATTALLAMAYGLNVVSGAEPDYYDFIGETENRPIINAPLDVDALTGTIEDVILHPEEIAERGRRSREFVVKHNDCVTVAWRYLNFWLQRLEHKQKC